MRDIVARLDEAIQAVASGKLSTMSIPVQDTDADIIMRDAKEEIMRLREENERLRGALGQYRTVRKGRKPGIKPSTMPPRKEEASDA